MLRAGRWLTAVAAAVASVAAATPAAADDDPPVQGCHSSWVCLSAKDPGTPPSGTTDNAPPKKTTTHGRPPVCTAHRLDPQPPADNPVWDGHPPGQGAIYVRTCPWDAGGTAAMIGYEAAAQTPFWSASTPAQTVNPVILAQEAVSKMQLSAPDIGIAPKPSGTGVVGMPVYMWTAKSAETYGPNTATATAGAVTVTATAKVSRIVWTMGDGQSVTCTTAGTPYQPSFGKQPSPDCGYRYAQPSTSQPSGKYHVTATSTWTVDWTGAGQSGQLTETRNSAVDITVAEVQVLN